MIGLTFTQFCRLLKLRLTRGQMVLAKVAYDDLDPCQLEGEERELARRIFGDVETIPTIARRVLCLVLGRNSGKTTLAAAYCIFRLFTASVEHCGPGVEPAVVGIGPRRKNARLLIKMGRALVRRVPELERHVVSESTDGFTIERDGRSVGFYVFAASRGGVDARGLEILTFVLEEAQFFLSDSNYVVTDRDSYSGLIPRLVRGGKAVLISTIWPVPTLMGELFEKNFGHCATAVAAKAPTLLMRDNDPEVAATIELERARDPENAEREFDCNSIGISGRTLFFGDGAALEHARKLGLGLTMPRQPAPLSKLSAGADFGFTVNSSALAVAECLDRRVSLLALDELKPMRGAPLVPSAVVRAFARTVQGTYGLNSIMADAHYAEAVREHLREHRMTLKPAPGGAEGKAATYVNLRKLASEERFVIPSEPSAIVSRAVAQLKATTAKPLEGGGLRISSPTVAGAHGDVGSAIVLAVYACSESTRQSGSVGWYDPYTQEGDDD